MSARTTALTALIACRKSGAWSDAVLKDYIRRDKLDARDAALATRLCSGVLQNRALMDYYVGLFFKGNLKKLQPIALDILRLGVYQITMMDRIPAAAAVNEAVEQAKHYVPKASGVINGVLRSMLREKDKLVPPKDYAIAYSHPAELVDLMKASVGKNLKMVLEADNSQPETCVQVNTLKTDLPSLKAALEAEGVTVTEHPWMEGCLLLKGTGDLSQLKPFREGWMQVQDAAAKLSVQVLGLKPGMKVLDLCAAPGGKSLAAAMDMENQGSILSCDLHEGKLGQIRDAAERLGVTIIEATQNDGGIFRPEWEGAFDAVIADVPCSGLGVIRKKPDIRYKPVKELEGLPEIQKKILSCAGRYVKKGGVLLYSTCTILSRENEAVAEEFLSANPDFTAETLTLPEGIEEQKTGMLTLYQGIHDCDGFFLCKMRANT